MKPHASMRRPQPLPDPYASMSWVTSSWSMRRTTLAIRTHSGGLGGALQPYVQVGAYQFHRHGEIAWDLRESEFVIGVERSGAFRVGPAAIPESF